MVTKNRRHISDQVFTPSWWEVLRRNASTILVHRHSFDPSVGGGKQERATLGWKSGGGKDEPNELTPQPPHTKVQPTDTITEAFLKNMYGLSRSSRGRPSTALSREVWPELPSAAEWSDPRGSEKQDAARFRGKSVLGGSRPLPTGVRRRANQRLENRPTDRVSRTPAHCEGRGDLCPSRGARAAHHAKEAPPTAPPPEASTPVTSGPEPGGAARRPLRVTPQSDQQNVSPLVFSFNGEHLRLCQALGKVSGLCLPKSHILPHGVG